MSNYRLLLVGEGRTGFVFCAGEPHARASARALLELHPLAHAVEVADDSGPVCRIEREPLALVEG
jgi:hypothetical protein